MVTNDTIVAISTPVGKSAIGAIRLSGSQSFEIVKKHIKKTLKLRHATYAYFKIDDKILDDVIVISYMAPHTYTGEDMIEIFFHGNYLLLSNALVALINSGARMAENGEFTKRAFLNGKMDLTQAETVEELIDSTSMIGIENARKIMNGNLSSEISKIREELIRISSEIEVRMDYPEEFEEKYNIDPETLNAVTEKLDRMLFTYKPARASIDGIKVALYGATNVGKSSILNALIGFERAIVTPIPGTTRDTIEVETFVNGLKIKIIDTAGLRETGDEIEKIGVERTISTVKSAEIKVYVVDATRDMDEDPVFKPDIKIINKIDLANKDVDGAIKLSAKTGYGIDKLRLEIERISKNYVEQLNSSNTILVAERQYSLVKKCFDELNEAINAVINGYTMDVIAINIRNAIEYLDLLTGRVYVDDLLDRIFTNFCVGK